MEPLYFLHQEASMSTGWKGLKCRWVKSSEQDFLKLAQCSFPEMAIHVQKETRVEVRFVLTKLSCVACSQVRLSTTQQAGKYSGPEWKRLIWRIPAH